MEIKTCKTCGIGKEVCDFGIVKDRKGQDCRLRSCKECISNQRGSYFNDYYAKNRAAILEHVRQRRRENVQRMLDYLGSHPCVDCGETDPVVLEFDHVRGKKKYNMASRVYSAARWTTIMKEIEKCDVRCANCHRRMTARRAGGWYYKNEQD